MGYDTGPWSASALSSVKSRTSVSPVSLFNSSSDIGSSSPLNLACNEKSSAIGDLLNSVLATLCFGCDSTMSADGSSCESACCSSKNARHWGHFTSALGSASSGTSKSCSHCGQLATRAMEDVLRSKL